MTAIASAADAANPLDNHSSAVALWTFIYLKTLWVTRADVLDVVRELGLQLGEDFKGFAKRLRVALACRQVSLKHTHALEACYKSWHMGGSEATK